MDYDVQRKKTKYSHFTCHRHKQPLKVVEKVGVCVTHLHVILYEVILVIYVHINAYVVVLGFLQFQLLINHEYTDLIPMCFTST